MIIALQLLTTHLSYFLILLPPKFRLIVALAENIQLTQYDNKYNNNNNSKSCLLNN